MENEWLISPFPSKELKGYKKKLKPLTGFRRGEWNGKIFQNHRRFFLIFMEGGIWRENGKTVGEILYRAGE